MISIIVSTARLGGMDVLFNTIDNQLESTPIKFELVLIDEYYEERRDIIEEILQDEYNFSYQYAPPDKKNDYFDPCHGCNTGLRYAKGELIIYLTDYTWIPGDFLSRHWEVYKNTNYTLTGYQYKYAIPPIRDYETEEQVYFSVFKEEWTHDVGKFFEKWVNPVYVEKKGGKLGEKVNNLYELPGNLFYAAVNESIPMKVMEKLNGWDERYDGGYGACDIDLGVRANNVGHKFLVDPTFYTYKFGQPTAEAKNIPGIKKKKTKEAADNFQFYTQRMQKIVTGEESIETPEGYGAFK